MKHLILLGAPGSGKGTQAHNLVTKLNYLHVSTGNLLRAEIAKESELGKEVKSIMDSGLLVSDELVVRLLKVNLDVEKNKYIFDGYPRNLNQAKTLDYEIIATEPSAAIYFDINVESLVERLSNRRTCSGCGTIYNLISKQPRVPGICDNCASHNLVQRVDDQKDVIVNRLKVFQETIKPVLDYYQETARLIKINADKSEAEIFKQILTNL